jgi:carboxymethylenebutenolidase
MPNPQITIENTAGVLFYAYCALPAAGHGPAVDVLQEILGVNAHIRGVCDFYAEEGYVTIAPDPFHQFAPGIELSYGEADVEQTFAYYRRFDVD